MSRKKIFQILGGIIFVVVVAIAIIFIKANSNEDGTVSLENQLYGSRNEFVGDASQDSELLLLLGVGDFGNYEMELITSKEPYVLIINFQESVSLDESEIENYSFLILALIDNLDEVHWKVPSQSIDYSITCDDAKRLLGDDVKSYGKTPKGIKILLDRIYN